MRRVMILVIAFLLSFGAALAADAPEECCSVRFRGRSRLIAQLSRPAPGGMRLGSE
jgi:hypothetical protein